MFRRLPRAARFLLLVAALCSSLPSLRAQSPLLQWLRLEGDPAHAGPHQGQGSWRFLRSELRHLAEITDPSTAGKAAEKALPALAAYHQALAARQIRLILVPIPEKARMRADQLQPPLSAPAIAQPDQPSKAPCAQLRAKGLGVLDFSADYRAELKRGEDPGYCRSDSHFSPKLCEFTANQLASALRSTLPKAEPSLGPFKSRELQVSFSGDLAQDKAQETLSCRQVTLGDARIEPAESSPLLLLGDSHCLIFHAGGDMLASSSGLCDHLTAATGLVPAVVAVRGGGATTSRINLSRKANKDPAFLAKTKVVLWCLAARDLTQAMDWKIVPLAK